MRPSFPKKGFSPVSEHTSQTATRSNITYSVPHHTNTFWQCRAKRGPRPHGLAISVCDRKLSLPRLNWTMFPEYLR